MSSVRMHAVGKVAADASAITATLTAVFVHPEASQCSTAMTAQYVSQFFSADAARSGTSVGRECRDHQRVRAQLAQRYRLVSVHHLLVTGHRAHAIVRGANGYPIAVSLVKGSSGWRLDASGTAVQAPGLGPQIAPQGSLYAYRIPPRFVAAGTAVGPVTTTGAAFSRASGSPVRGRAMGSRSRRPRPPRVSRISRGCAGCCPGSTVRCAQRRSRA